MYNFKVIIFNYFFIFCIKEALSNKRVGSLSVSKLAVTLLPRYHFVGKMQTFYERPPYRYVSKKIETCIMYNVVLKILHVLELMKHFLY